MVPYKLFNIVKYVVEQPKLQHTGDDLEAGRQRYRAVKKTAAQRRAHGAQY